ncbi:hypothetical protein [Corynebacterium sp. CQ3829_602738]
MARRGAHHQLRHRRRPDKLQDRRAASTFETPFSANEVAYVKSAASYTAQRFEDCGKDINRTAPAAPSSLNSEVAPGTIAGIVAVVLALLGVGAAFAVSAGMVPGLTLPALPF